VSSDLLPPAGGPPPGTFLTFRSVLIGSAICVLSGLAGPYWNLYMYSSPLFADYNAAGPTFALVMAVLVFNILLAGLWRRFGLRAGELRAITAMALTGGSIVTSGLIAYLVTGLTAPYYHAAPSNQMNVRVWPHLRERLFALDPDGGMVAIQKWWSGIPDSAPMPLRPWIGPLLWWGLFVLGMFGLLVALMAIMRKQWMDYEHLSFPIAQVPAEVCNAVESPRSPGSILRSRPFWIGVGFALVIGTSRALGHYFGGFPSFSIRHRVSGLGPMDLRVNVSLTIIGLTFLIPNRVAFSIWSLSLASWVLRSFIREYDFGMNQWLLYGVVGHPELQYVSMGSMIVFAAGSFWAARRHLGRVLLCSVGRARGYDRGEPASYRTAVAFVVFGAVIVVGWFCMTGMKLIFAVPLLLCTVIIYYGMARVIAQCGLPAINSPILPSVFMGGFMGGGALGAEQSVALGTHLMWHADLRNSPMSGAAHGMYLTGKRSGGLFWAMIGGLFLAYWTAAFTTIWLGYRHGASTMHVWYITNSSRLTWIWTAQLTQNESGLSMAALAWTTVGAAVMLGLTVAQRVLFWWPFHPVGFLTSGTFLVTAFWFSIFLAWFIKLCFTYAAGARGYRLARHFFIGAVLGGFVGGGLWAIIDTITGQMGNAVFRA